MKEHSERVLGKNIRVLDGRPLFCYIIDSLLESRVEHVVINTDSELIFDAVKAIYPWIHIFYRPEYLRGDMVTGNALIAWTLEQLNDQHFVYTHTTNPLLKPATIDAAVERYYSNIPEYDSLFGVTKYQIRLFKANGEPLNHDPANLQRTQDLDPLYEDNSTMYIFSRDSFAKTRNRIGERPYMFEVPKAEAYDIDTEDDWKLVEAVMHCES